MKNRQKPHGPNVWVIRRADGFSITEERSGRCLVPPLPQRRAVAIARAIAKANRSELIVQGRSGRIRFRDSHGSDPFPPRG
jgi:uncharacterized protein DUF2188